MSDPLLQLAEQAGFAAGDFFAIGMVPAGGYIGNDWGCAYSIDYFETL